MISRYTGKYTHSSRWVLLLHSTHALFSEARVLRAQVVGVEDVCARKLPLGARPSIPPPAHMARVAHMLDMPRRSCLKEVRSSPTSRPPVLSPITVPRNDHLQEEAASLG